MDAVQELVWFRLNERFRPHRLRCYTTNLGRFKGVVCREVDGEEEDAALVRTVILRENKKHMKSTSTGLNTVMSVTAVTKTQHCSSEGGVACVGQAQ